MKNEFDFFESHSKSMKSEMRSLWGKAILLWLLNVVFSITVLCAFAYLITRVVMFAIGQ